MVITSLAPQRIPQNPGPIIGAGSQSIIQSAASLPNVLDVLDDWLRPMTLVVISTRNVDGYAKEVKREVQTVGLYVPISSPAKVGSAGTRTLQNSYLYAIPSLALDSLDKVEIEGTRFAVVDQKNYGIYGYIRYELTEDFTNGRV